jgi:pyridinium-3,5-biscarboxylic acid mononucleotide sulfurtransferase
MEGGMPASKLIRLNERLKELERVVVAFSGGVDSTFLLRAARDVLGRGRVLAVTAVSEIHPESEIGGAKRLARSIGVKHLLVRSGEMEDEAFLSNPPDRCYECKRRVFGSLRALAAERGFGFVIDGTNADDAADFRPGRRALHELGIVSPLQEAGFTKREIRVLSKKWGLPTWNRPALACLATRIPYGTRITPGILKRIDAGETWLRRMGFLQVRVRDHGDLARIEIAAGEMGRARASGFFAKAAAKFKSIGYRYVTLDLEGYRTGSLNEAIRKKTK